MKKQDKTKKLSLIQKVIMYLFLALIISGLAYGIIFFVKKILGLI